MIRYAEWIPQEFAEIFEWAKLPDGDIDFGKYHQARDDFYQVVRGQLGSGEETKDDIESRFSRAPEVSNKKVLSFAAGNAEYYSRILGLKKPSWTDDVPPVDGYGPFIPFCMMPGGFDEHLKQTPPELLARNIVYREHDFSIY